MDYISDTELLKHFDEIDFNPKLYAEKLFK